MTYDDIRKRLANPSPLDASYGNFLENLYWLRDTAIPELVRKIEAQELTIQALRTAVAREGAMNQEGKQ